jgi:hypothetical protein
MLIMNIITTRDGECTETTPSTVYHQGGYEQSFGMNMFCMIYREGTWNLCMWMVVVRDYLNGSLNGKVKV